MKNSGKIIIGSLISAILTLIILIGLTGQITKFNKNQAEIPQGWHLVWSDEFDGKTIDETKWAFQTGTGTEYGLDGWGNKELQYYRKENAYIKNGSLVIAARKQNYKGCDYTSARLRTIRDDGTPLFAKTYGRIEAKIKVTTGNGIWPAFWLLPATDEYGTWASSGEIDIMEAKGRLPNRVYGTVNFGQAWPGNKYTSDMYKFPGTPEEGGTIAEYHIYSLEWEPGVLRWLVDGNKFFETSQWWSLGNGESKPYAYPAPYDKPFYIILNLALGGNYDAGIIPEDSDLPAQMFVDWVRVYDKDEPYATNVKRPIPERDEKHFSQYKTSDGTNFIFDPSLKDINSDEGNKGMFSAKSMDVYNRAWYFLTLEDYGGQATSFIEKDKATGIEGRRVKISNIGNQTYSVQLIQHLPIAKGYSYKIEFDAKASAARQITIKLGGDTDNDWAVYSPEYYPQLTTEVQHFEYYFTMNNETDVTSRLEFNIGLNPNDVWLSNVRVTQEDL